MFEWEYIGDLLDKKLGVMWECPDYFEEDGETVFIASVCGENQENKDKDKFIFWANPTYFILENNSLENLPVKYKYFEELENGFDFYAPQTLSNPENKNIIISWMYTFGERIITDESNLNHGWSHCLTLPREISIKNGKLYQTPVKSIEKYRKNEIAYENFSFDRNNFKLEKGMPYSMNNGIVNLPKLNGGKCSEIIISADISETKKFTMVLPAGVLEFDKVCGLITFDRTNFGHDMRSEKQKEENGREIKKMNFDYADNLNLRIFIDVSAVEIFINESEKIISSRFYPEDKEYKVEFKSEGMINIKEIKKYDVIIVDKNKKLKKSQ